MAAALVVPGAASHGIGVNIDRIDRVTDGNRAVGGENVTDVAGVAFGAVRDENLIRLDLHPEAAIMDVGDFLPQEIIAKLRTIAAEGCGFRLFSDGLVQGGDDAGRQRPGHIANAQTDDRTVRIGSGERTDALGDVGEQVAAGQAGVVFVNSGHEMLLDWYFCITG